MYGRADGMPSFQLTVAVCAMAAETTIYDYRVTSQTRPRQSQQTSQLALRRSCSYAGISQQVDTNIDNSRLTPSLSEHWPSRITSNAPRQHTFPPRHINHATSSAVVTPLDQEPVLRLAYKHFLYARRLPDGSALRVNPLGFDACF